jgi:hypothetical protein
MKAFLKDYGMHWVGSSSSSSSSAAAPVRPSPTASSSPTPLAAGALASAGLRGDAAGAPLDLKSGMWQPGVAVGEGGKGEGRGDKDVEGDQGGWGGPEALGVAFDPARIAGNVKQLNMLAGQGEKEIAVGADGMRRFKDKALVAYVFYNNGIFGRGGPLRPYHLAESKVLVNDLMDGYFPWELKDEYPEGVPLRVEFRLGEAWGKAAPGGSADNGVVFKPFAGVGQALGAGGGVGGEGGGEQGQVGGREVRQEREVYQPLAGKGLGETLFRRLPDKVPTLHPSP